MDTMGYRYYGNLENTWKIENCVCVCSIGEFIILGCISSLGTVGVGQGTHIHNLCIKGKRRREKAISPKS